MVKIIEEGKKVFTETCFKCGCKFSYELEDVDFGYVCCPCCKERVYHKRQDNIQTPNIVLCSNKVD